MLLCLVAEQNFLAWLTLVMQDRASSNVPSVSEQATCGVCRPSEGHRSRVT